MAPMELLRMGPQGTGSGVRGAWRDFLHQAGAFCCPRLLVALLLLGLVLGRASAATTASPRTRLPRSSAELFGLTNIWTVHLRFTAEQWEAMQPVGDDRQPLNGPGGLRRQGQAGPPMLLARAMLEQGDLDHDHKLSQAEFEGLAEKWFQLWDKPHAGQLSPDQLREGFQATLRLAAAGPMAGGRFGQPPGLTAATNSPGTEKRRNGLAANMGIEFKYVRADVEFEGKALTNVAVRYKGNGTYMQSRNSLKRSFKIDLNRNVKGQKLAGVTKLNLHNNVSDPGWMNEVLSHRLYRDARLPAPRTAYARVFVTVPGKFDRQYFGLYSLVEDIDKNFLEDRYTTTKGALLKPATPGGLLTDWGQDWSQYQQAYDPKTELSEKQTQHLMAFCQLVSHADDAEFAARVGDYLDLDEFARYMAVTTWLCTLDSILGGAHNFYVYVPPKNGPLQFLPWDLDHSFGHFGMAGTMEQREQLSIAHPWRGEKRFLERVYKVEAFHKLYLARMNEFSRTLFNPQRLRQQVDDLAVVLRQAVQEESAAKLAAFDREVAGESSLSNALGILGGRLRRALGALPGAAAAPAVGGRAPAKPIKEFVQVRALAVVDQLAGRSPGQTLDDVGPGGRALGAMGGLAPARALLAALDQNRDGVVSHAEFVQGFSKWFVSWDAEKTGFLSMDQMTDGFRQELMSRRAGGAGPMRQQVKPPN